MAATSERQNLFHHLGREAGCLCLSRNFYARVAQDPTLKALFPGKTLRCATEEFAAFLVQFFEGEESEMQQRSWLSLRESHARFQITEAQRSSWLWHMNSALDSLITDTRSLAALRSLFQIASTYIVPSTTEQPDKRGPGDYWLQQLSLDELIDAIVAGEDNKAIVLAGRHTSRRTVNVGILARMMKTARPQLIEFTLTSLERDSALLHARFNGRSLTHFAAGSGCLPVLLALFEMGADPNLLDHGGYPPLYRAANECKSTTGPLVIRELVRAGALVNQRGGVTRSTALHAAARRGHLQIALALMDEGASTELVDSKGFSPLDRARNCRKLEVLEALQLRVAGTKINL